MQQLWALYDQGWFNHCRLRLFCCMQVRNRNSEEYNVLKIQLEGIIEELERHFEQVRRLVQCCRCAQKSTHNCAAVN